MTRLASLIALALAVCAAAGAESAGTPDGRPLLVTVDDLPVAAGRLHDDPAERARITAELLAVLAKHRVPAVGFVIWGNVRSDADRTILERWLAAGHELGNHSDGHPDFTRTGLDAHVADVEAGRAGLAGWLAGRGRGARLFRFPYLREGDTLEKLDGMRAYLERSGQRAAPVTIDNQDWEFERPWVEARRAGDAAAQARIADDYQRAMRAEVVAQTELGDELFERPVPQVLLLHANEVGAAQWDALFSWLSSRGYRFATADEVLADPALAPTHRFVNAYGGSLWHRVQRERHSEKARAAVAAALAEQSAAWSRGDLEGFCSIYAEDTLFLSPNGVTRGRQAVLDRYRTRYPDAAAMGTLTLEPIEVREAWGNEVSLFGDALPSRTHGVSVAARWTLRKADGTESSGMTLIVFHRLGGRWVIVQDASM
ncbi:MAG: polysaccharide deacetylase family protein [Acidobacteriota bacterium]